jgi:hypothetical protein
MRKLLGRVGVTLIVLFCVPVVGRPDNCDDAIPTDCKSPRFLGEDQGCACFECNPKTPEAKVICTRDSKKKKVLFALVPHASATIHREHGNER